MIVDSGAPIPCFQVLSSDTDILTVTETLQDLMLHLRHDLDRHEDNLCALFVFYQSKILAYYAVLDRCIPSH